MKRMGRKSGAIGFALYLDLLDSFLSERTTYDVDIIMLYDDDADLTLLNEMVSTYIKKGLTVSVQKQRCTGVSMPLSHMSVISRPSTG